ncbi:MAG: YdcF family protein [Salinarimonadaceae bacterium]|nr:MAG: YdcF family protein [Salinarimonadaceae bacterium]
MFFYLSKILWFLATPSNLLATLALIGIVFAAATRLRRAGLALAGASLITILAAGLSPLPSIALRTIEARFPVPDIGGVTIDGIIILGGSLAPDETFARGQPDLNEAAERIVVGLELALRHPQARILLSGGSGRLFGETFTEAEATARLLEALGLPRERMILEGRSRNTHENAVYSLEAVQPSDGENWLLVTSAFHMPRSVGAYRQAGFPVIPFPVDFRTGGPDDPPPGFASVSGGLRRLDVATREWVGLAAYYVTGRTDALFPAP